MEPSRKKLKLQKEVCPRHGRINMKFLEFVNKRSCGWHTPCYKFKRKLESSLSFATKLSCFDQECFGVTGSQAIYNIEFSKDDKLLLAAGATSAVFILDPLSHKKIAHFNSYHVDGVNCMTFIDSRLFTTCSDDNTIALWDIRNCSTRVSTLKGHTDWVKSTSYIAGRNTLVSSGFDDTIRMWNLNDIQQDAVVKNTHILDVKFLTRTEITADFSKLIVATTTGHLFCIDDLDLDHLKEDTHVELTNCLNNPPDIFQETTFRKRNRVEFLSDFPADSNPWCVMSIKAHPGGGSVLSRFSTIGSNGSDWTVVHDITRQKRREMNTCLKYFIEEPNAAAGYIKEICYNDDGSLICSPFGNTIRLLASNSRLEATVGCGEELFHQPQALYEVGFVATSHKYPVLTSRFANSLFLLASGCLGGQVAFYQPKF